MSAVFDFNGLKTRIKSILSDANTTTATYPLSNNLGKKVNFISKFNPDMVFNQTTQHPSIHIYPESKTVNLSDIAKNQISGKRIGLIKMNIMGVYSEFSIDNKDEDVAQKNLEIMMENIELNLRAEPNLQNFTGVRWQAPTDIQYGVAAFQEDVYYRVGVMTLDINTFY